eukprot:gnl/Spiro4/3817_TR1887_c0_g1_i1.p1 gnl/Spiro4/3817_TR1887_c0_g1~~gnl/Spiro4/3817_TR1887_c0_g1_i1.p1  ORF type:complete len:532 (+),score=143.67 gnl/Spiro4/3817_TR1887_c0_g1_i1:69-1664(+)
MSARNPTQVLADDTKEEKGSNARLSAFLGAIAISDLVKTTLGPQGMDKILQPAGTGPVQITNDGATILKSIQVDNPAAKILVDISKTQDDEVGDGTTSVCVLAGELLREAEKLVAQKIHPQIIVQGWRLALEAARNALTAATLDRSADPEVFRQDLLNIAKTTLSSKLLNQDKEFFARLAVDAVMRLKGGALDLIQIIKKPGGTLRDSELAPGFILDKKFGVGQPKRIENARVLIANTQMDNDKIKIFGASVQTSNMTVTSEVEKAERDRMMAKCEKILAYQPNVFINRQLIYNLPEQFFADHGVAAIEHADFDGIERLSKVLRGDIISTFDNPGSAVLGTCELVDEIMIGEDKVIRFSGVAAGEACTIVLRGSSSHILEEADRSLHDALCVLSETLKETRIVFGGGCSEMLMAQAVEQAAATTPGKKAIAMQSFAHALRQIPNIICDNAGFDAAELCSMLRAEHANGSRFAGIDVRTGITGNMMELGITESFKVKQQVLLSAAEAAEMIVRVDEIIQMAPRQRQADPRMG